MDKNRKVRGFTMAEMLIVVAIIMVLSGVAFIAVASHQRSMAQLERDTVAKEIFVAAQNHLTMAESQGYLPDEEEIEQSEALEEYKFERSGKIYAETMDEYLTGVENELKIIDSYQGPFNPEVLSDKYFGLE